jgi:hypothetical protein
MIASMRSGLLGAVSCSALAVLCVPGSVLAEEPSCKAVLAAQRHQINVPYHGHSTVTLIPGQTKPSEEIYTGKAQYILQDGKWTVSPITSAMMGEQLEDNIKNGKMACHALGDEAVDGVSATLYSVHEEVDGVVADFQIWISKSTGLPVLLKMAAIESHYTYTDVVVPSVR